MKIGDVTLDNPVFLAPMAGVTDLPFRLLCKEQGCGLVYTEMISAKAIYYGNQNTQQLLTIDPKEKPIAVQLFGSDPSLLADMARKIDNPNIDIFDINMGCPVPKVVKNNEGSALLRHPKRVAEIVKKVSSVIDKPLTIKIRKGFNDETVNAVEIAKIAEDSGAAAIGVHGRTREQYYSGQADWDIIRRVKEAVTIPVFGNGDVFGPEDAKRLLEETACDGILVGRGAMGNPWIFSRINHYLENNEILEKPSIQEIVKTILRHTQMLIDYKGEYVAMREMRKHVSWYIKGIRDASKIRGAVHQVTSYTELEQHLHHLLFNE